jgi:hypothetical protein
MNSDAPRWLGIDPGYRGALAIVGPEGEYVDALSLTEGTAEAWAAWLRARRPFRGAVVEAVSPGPKMDRASTMKLGRSQGLLLGMCVALEIPVTLALPLRWQTDMGCRTGGDKRVTLRAAQARWPHVAMTHSGKDQLADALLLAEWCRRHG